MTDLVTVPEAAALLHLKESTIRAWLLRRRLAHVKLGRRVFLRTSDLQAIIDSSLVPARDQTEANS